MFKKQSMRWLPPAVSLTAACLLTVELHAQGGFNGPGRYEITNVRSGKVIDLDRNNQTSVIQFSARNTDNQQWDVLPAEPGYWFLRNGMNGAALEAMGNANSTPVQGRPFTGSPSQQWRITPANDGNALITNRLGKTLDIPNSAIRDGVRVQTYDINGEANQRFVFRRIGNTAGRAGPRDNDDDDWDRDRRWRQYYGRYDDREQRWFVEGDGACFFRKEGFRGRPFCVHTGDQVPRLPEEIAEHLGSVRFFGHVRGVEIFEQPDFGGRRAHIDHDQPTLDRLRSDRGDEMRRIASLRVY